MIYWLLVAWLIILFVSIIKLSISTVFKFILYISLASIIMKILGVI